MSTRIEVNLIGFERFNLKQKLDKLVAASRRELQERQRLESARQKGIKQARARARALGLSPSGQVYSGRFTPKKKIEEIGPRRAKLTDIGHSRIFNSSTSTITRNYITKYGVVIVPRPFGRPPDNFAGLYYRGIIGIPNSVTSATDSNLYIWPSKRFDPVLVDRIETSNPFDYPTYGNDGSGTRINYRAENQIGGGTIVIPIGKKNYIVISIMSYQWLTINLTGTRLEGSDPPPDTANFITPYRLFEITGHSVSSDASRTVRAFLCSEDFIREIGVPSALGEILELLHPSPVTTNGFVDESYLDIGPFSFAYTYPSFPSPSKFLNYEPVGLSTFNPVTPSIFKALNDVHQYTDQLREFGDNNWILPDKFRKPGWFYNPFWSGDLYYAKWPVAGQEPSVPVSNDRGDDLDGPFDDQAPELNLIRIDKPALSTLTNDPFLLDNNPNGSLFDRAPLSSFHVVWDWGDPGYCKAMCLALGFSELDLFI